MRTKQMYSITILLSLTGLLFLISCGEQSPTDITGFSENDAQLPILYSVAAGTPQFDDITPCYNSFIGGPILTAEVGSELTFTVQASDPEGGQLTLDWEPFGLPAGITLTPALPFTGPSPVSSIFSWIPTINDVTDPGTVLIIRFGVRDEDGNIAGCRVQIEVIDTPPGGGDQGCTPGFWKNHLEDWTGFNIGDDFDATFGVDLFDPDITLEMAVNAKGGGDNKLARHGTAALLSAAHPGVDYPISVSEVIALVQAGDADILVAFNELGCEID